MWNNAPSQGPQTFAIFGQSTLRHGTRIRGEAMALEVDLSARSLRRDRTKADTWEVREGHSASATGNRWARPRVGSSGSRHSGPAPGPPDPRTSWGRRRACRRPLLFERPLISGGKSTLHDVDARFDDGRGS